MKFLGIDHGTRAIRIAYGTSKKSDVWEIPRKKELKKKFIEMLKERVDLYEIKLIGLTYSMGDGISTISDIRKVKNRGVKSILGAGKIVGTGTMMYDDIKNSNMPCIIIPGVHRDIESLDSRFKILYSHHASGKKVSSAYYSYMKLSPKNGNMIITHVSSNTVTLLIRCHKIIGGFDACVGALGMLQGPLDVEDIRRIDSMKITANDAFSTSGIGIGLGGWEKTVKRWEKKDAKGLRYLDALVSSVCSEIISSMIYYENVNEIEYIVLTGTVGSMKSPINFERRVKEKIRKIFDIEIKSFDRFSSCRGALMIAEDVFNGKKDILGIKVSI